MALFDKEKLANVLSKAKDSATKVAKETTESIKNTKGEIDTFNAPAEGSIRRYEVIYKGGLQKYQDMKKTSGSFGLNIMEDGLFLKTGYGSKEWFEDMYIKYENIKKIDIIERTISNAEFLLSSSNSDMKAMEQKNNIEITYDSDNGVEVVLRLEMLTGVSIYAQAGKCREMMDVLRQNGLLKKIKGEEKKVESDNNDVLSQIEKLSELFKAGILSEEEFNKKKSELLSKL